MLVTMMKEVSVGFLIDGWKSDGVLEEGRDAGAGLRSCWTLLLVVRKAPHIPGEMAFLPVETYACLQKVETKPSWFLKRSLFLLLCCLVSFKKK